LGWFVTPERFRDTGNDHGDIAMNGSLDAVVDPLPVASSDDDQQKKYCLHEQIMIQQARKAAMGELLGVVAHKWRQPLNVISLLVQNIKDAWDFGELDESFLQQSTFRILEQVNLLSHTIDDFRSYLNPSNGEEQFNPEQSVREVIAVLSSCFTNFARITLLATDEEQEVQVTGSRHGFQQVAHNLLCNANDALFEQQRRNGSAFSGLITISFQRDEHHIIITVSDNGGGIEESMKDRIFDPFFTTKKNSNGFGVGLYLSKIIVENSMLGSLWHENSADGSRFFIRLPIATVARRPS